MLRLGVFAATLIWGLSHSEKLSADDRLPPIPSSSVPTIGDFKAAVEHLLKAAEHLQAAGLMDEASHILLEARRLAVSEDVVARKEAELECLLEELDRIRDVSGQFSQIEIEAVIFEFSRSELGRDAEELDSLLGFNQCDEADESSDRRDTTVGPADGTGDTSIKILDWNPAQGRTFQYLLDTKRIKLVSRPMLRTLSRRTTSIMVGRQIVSVEVAPEKWIAHPVGGRLSLETRPTALAGGRLRLQTKFEVVDFSAQDQQQVDGTEARELFNQSLETSVELRQGQTVVLVHRLRNAGSSKPIPDPSTNPASVAETSDREFVLLLTPRKTGYDRFSPPQALEEPAPAEAELTLEELMPFIMPADYEYFPVTPVPQKGAGPK